MGPLSRHEHVKYADAVFKRHGLLFTIGISGKHIKFRVQIAGRVQCFVAPKTPSDHRSLMNFRGDIRRRLRVYGIEVEK